MAPNTSISSVRLLFLFSLFLALALALGARAIAAPFPPPAGHAASLVVPDTMHLLKPLRLPLDAEALARPRQRSAVTAQREDAMAEGWVTIFSDDFEGDFPGQWIVNDHPQAPGEYYWGKRDCQAYAGSYSAWAVGGGDDGAHLPCGSDYPDYAYSYMFYGPFSLEGATAAEMTFQLWLNSESGFDSIFWGFSTDGAHYWGGDQWTGYSDGWMEKGLNLTAAVGEPEVRITFIFTSNHRVRRAEGAYVDNVVLRKQVGAAETPTPTPTHTLPAPPEFKAYLPIVIKHSMPMAASWQHQGNHQDTTEYCAEGR